MTRHPRMGAVEEPKVALRERVWNEGGTAKNLHKRWCLQVAAREPSWNQAAKGKSGVAWLLCERHRST